MSYVIVMIVAIIFFQNLGLDFRTPDHQGHSTANKLATNPSIRGATWTPMEIHPLPNRNMTADVGQYQTIEAAQSGLQKLKGWLTNCLKRSMPFCDGLIDKSSVQEVNWPGDPEHTTFFLVIKNLDDPTFYALCNYMWNAEEPWARETFHRCTDFDHRDDP